MFMTHSNREYSRSICLIHLIRWPTSSSGTHVDSLEQSITTGCLVSHLVLTEESTSYHAQIFQLKVRHCRSQVCPQLPVLQQGHPCLKPQSPRLHTGVHLHPSAQQRPPRSLQLYLDPRHFPRPHPTPPGLPLCP